jgi:hypothetical protein
MTLAELTPMQNKTQKHRVEKLTDIRRAKHLLQSQSTDITTEASELSALQSVALGLYEELDKLTKKSPVEAVTDFVLSQLNDVIRETKRLVADDAYVQKLNEAVSAGNNPEQRDAIVMLRQARQGLERHQGRIEPRIRIVRTRLNEADLMETAVVTFLMDGSSIKKDDFDRFSSGYSFPDWFYSGFPREFDFRRLDSTDILAHFNLK